MKDGALREVEALRTEVAVLEREKGDLEHAQRLLRNSEESERRFGEALTALVEITNELAMADTVDDLCRRAVELGRARLGFDRVGIWFRTDEPGVIVGSYGVDLNGQICDERNERTEVDATEPDGRILLSKEPFVIIGEAPLVNTLGETVGQASQMFAAMWDGEKVIGHVSADNTLRNEPLLQQQGNLLRLFGSVLGSLCTRKRIETERTTLIEDLQAAAKRIDTLHGLIPICAQCKKIRDDQGLWQRVEVYIRDHSDADFSHSLCPECTEELYPGLIGKRHGGSSPDGDQNSSEG